MSNTFKDTVETDPELIWKARNVELQRQHLVILEDEKHKRKVDECIKKFAERSQQIQTNK